MEKIPQSIGIHDGAFHADEVTACALLIVFGLADPKQIFRTREPALLAQCEYVCDVGGIYDPKRKLFDHHQVDYRGEMSSAGMVLLYLKDQGILTPEEYHHFHSTLVGGVDAHDNGRMTLEPGVASFSHVVANFTPPSYEATTEQMRAAFDEALAFVIGHITRIHARFRYNRECREVVESLMRRYRTCLIFERPIPWLDSFFALGGRDHSASFLIMPAGPHWKLRGIPPDEAHRMQVRLPLPQEWAGLLDKELKRVSGIEGAVFCHKGRFTSVWETKEDAMKALGVVLDYHGKANEDAL